jgi:hypothetical protein
LYILVGYWGGASDIGHEPGQFFWENGRKVDSGWWSIYNKADSRFGRKDCVYVFDGKLWDAPCLNVQNFICKADAKFTNCLVK